MSEGVALITRTLGTTPIGPYQPQAAIAAVHDEAASADDTDSMTHNHRLEAVRGHLFELAGDAVAARESYRRAARMTASIPEQRYLALRAAQLG